ncbi:MAG: ABC transporter ATP-binding protein [Muribaculaceae bacterium]|nr:ABC transporter ATP-binding protein [Muribaculaceae bacterium]MDE6449543.1 ABC transporter ATP-binding protein [Muribaculaceae bacterium]
MNQQSQPIVEVRHLSHRYTNDWAIRDINFTVDSTGILGLLGSNGAGKSTTMNIICGVLNQTEGDVFINGIDLRKNPVEAKRHIGFLPQKPPLYPDLTVDEYLVHCATLRRMSRHEIRPAVEQAKRRCDITHFSKRLIKYLSGGYQQRVGIAQAIVHSPRFVVLDEPTNGLDPNQILEVRGLIKEIAKERAVLLSTHILSEVQATCDNIRMIEHGHTVFAGTIDEFNNYAVPDTLTVTFAESPLPEQLAAIDGVLNVEQSGPGMFRIRFSGDDTISERIVARSVAEGWRLREIAMERSSLDVIFAQLSGKLKNNAQPKEDVK